MTITEFLLERIAEDEVVARDWRHHGTKVEIHGGGAGYAALVNPDRALAVCATHRQIVALHVVGDPDEWEPNLWACRLCQWDEDCDAPKQEHQHGAGRFPCPTLRLLALPYADHPEYREEWRP